MTDLGIPWVGVSCRLLREAGLTDYSANQNMNCPMAVGRPVATSGVA